MENYFPLKIKEIVDQSQYDSYRHLRSLVFQSSASSNQRSCEIAKLCMNSIAKTKLKFVNDLYHNQSIRSNGVTVMKFDNEEGTLVAIGNTTGLLRIYDFDECRLNLENSDGEDERNVVPVVKIHTERAISDVSWSKAHMDELAISFSYDPSIHIYDLNAPDQPKVILQSSRGSCAGHNLLMYYDDMTSHPNNSKECLIAGSTNGYIRMWNTRRSTRPSWEANVSTGIGVETENAVTGLYIDERDGVNGTLLFVLSKAGYIFVYDLKKFQVMTFQSVPTPVCIKRYQIMPSVLTSNRSHDGYAYLGLFVCPNKRGILYCNSTSGHTIELDLHNEKASWYHPDIIDFIAVNRLIGSDNIQEISSSLSNAGSCVELIPIRHYPLSAQLSVLLPWSKPHFCSFLPGSSRLLLFNRSINFDDTVQPSHQGPRQAIRKMDDITEELRFVRYNRNENNPKLNLTLPGKVVQAQAGSYEVQISVDLRSYLADSAIASSCPSRSNHVYFELVYDMTIKSSLHGKNTVHHGNTVQKKRLFSELAVDSNHSSSSDNLYKGEFHTIAQVMTRTLQLKEPYRGPDIVDGFPHMIIRTNLIPKTGVTEDENQRSRPRISKKKDIVNIERSISCCNINISSCSHRTISLDNMITAVTAHPIHPYVIVGLTDDDIILLAS